MAEATFVKARYSTTIPLLNGTHRNVDAGETVDLSETPDWFQEKVKTDAHTKSVFTSSSKSAHGKQENLADRDPAARAINHGEEVTRARIEAEPDPSKRRGGPGLPAGEYPGPSTLPVSGADVDSDARFAAQKGADTSEAQSDNPSDDAAGDPPPLASPEADEAGAKAGAKAAGQKEDK
jgi:hypothetical protein